MNEFDEFSCWRAPNQGLELIQEPHGVLVCQNGDAYLARGWKLNSDLISIIQSFLDAGFSCLIREGHPRRENRKKGVDYIGFSATTSDWWVAVLDKSSGQVPVMRITVTKKLRDFLITTGISFVWETAGGRNIFIDRAILSDFLALLSDRPHNKQFEEPYENSFLNNHRSGIENETSLQSLVIDAIAKGKIGILGNVICLHANPRWRRKVDGLDPQIFDIPDIVVETAESLWILELKLNEIGDSAIDQAARYATNSECIRLANGRNIHAVTLGHRCSIKSIQRFPTARGLTVEVWLYTWSVLEGIHISKLI